MSFYIGLDLGGTNLKYALGTATGSIVTRGSKPSLADQSQDVIFENMFSAVEELLNQAKSENQTVTAIGIGSPGVIDFSQGKLLGRAPNFEHWQNVPIRKIFEQRFDIPTWVDNDANLLALAEARHGAGKRFHDLLCVTLGTGIGGGIVLNDQLHRGMHYSAAEIGHVIIEYGGRPCNCGNRGCLEAYAAAPAMVDRYRHKLKRTGVIFDIDGLSAELIFEKAQLNEDLARETINETCDYLGAGLASIVNVIDPEIVIIGGGVAEAGMEFIRRIEHVIRQFTLKPIAQKIKVAKAQLNLDAGVVGAILLAAENYMKK